MLQRAEGKLSEAEYKESLKAAYQGLLSNCGYAGKNNAPRNLFESLIITTT